ncbi:hypothetical protein GC177_02705 [bacterium]|nr:hypothetical protein [bacterium]
MQEDDQKQTAIGVLARAFGLPESRVRFDEEMRCLELLYPLPAGSADISRMGRLIQYDIWSIYDAFLQKPLARHGFREAFPTRLDSAYREPRAFREYDSLTRYPNEPGYQERPCPSLVMKWRMPAGRLEKMIDALCRISLDEKLLGSITRANFSPEVSYDGSGRRLLTDAPLPEGISTEQYASFVDFMANMDFTALDESGPTPY